jgi:transcriptional regulatory protein LevR
VPDIPFISLQDLLSKRGIQLVFELLGHHLEILANSIEMVVGFKTVSKSVIASIDNP